MTNTKAENPCPNCKLMVEVGPYKCQTDGTIHPDDVECPQCNAILNHTVPFFSAITRNGWIWTIVKPATKVPPFENAG